MDAGINFFRMSNKRKLFLSTETLMTEFIDGRIDAKELPECLFFFGPRNIYVSDWNTEIGTSLGSESEAGFKAAREKIEALHTSLRVAHSEGRLMYQYEWPEESGCTSIEELLLFLKLNGYTMHLKSGDLDVESRAEVKKMLEERTQLEVIV